MDEERALAGAGSNRRIEEALRKSEASLAESQRIAHLAGVGEMVASVAHEVRNPLFAISGAVDALEANLCRPEEVQELLQLLRGQVRRLSELMYDLLEYSRPVSLSPQQGCLQSISGRAVDACAALALERGVTVRNRIPGDLAPVYLDEGRILRAFCNLLENAIQHAPAGSVVLVDAGAAILDGLPGLTCAVSDEGPGFSAADLASVFQLFFSRRAGGTGLGLSIVQRIIEGHGGRVLASNRPEGGARVSFWLPFSP